ncbi:MAG: right-handed parallel beta-helix repeat-containing protein [bacterium]
MSFAKRVATCLAVTTAAVLAGAPSDAAVVRVPTQFRSFGNAVLAAAPGDTVQVVGNGGATFHASDVHLDKDITIQGGWRADFRVRDASTYVSVLRDTTNANDRPILRILGTPRVVVDGVWIWGGQPGLVSGSGADVVLRNCTVRGQRNADPSGSLDGNRGCGVRFVGGTVLVDGCHITDVISQFGGAGMAVIGATSFILRNSALDGCQANRPIGDASGGALYVRDVPDMRLENTRIERSQSLQAAGLVYLQNTSATMTGGTFQDGQASTNGGGFYLSGCPSVVLDQCQFLHNLANSQGGAIVAQSVGSLVIRDSRFQSNQTGRASAHGLGSALWLSSTAFTIERTQFVGNHFDSPVVSVVAEQGGAVYAISSSGTVSETSFTDEKALGKGGTWYQVGGDIRFIQCRFVGSQAGVFGGALAIELGGSSTFDHCLLAGGVAKFGGALSASFTGGLVLDHCTVTGNTARSAGAGFYVDTAATMRMTNTIACCCPAGEVVFCQGGAATADHCDVWNDDAVNVRVEWGGACPDPTGASGNLRVDPQFCPGDPDYHLAVGSPCAGTASDGSDRGWRPAGCSLPSPTGVEPWSWGRLKALWR